MILRAVFGFILGMFYIGLIAQGSRQHLVADSSSVPRNTVYLEVLGAGGLGSLNYERLFFDKSPFMAGARIGIGSIHFTDFTRRFNPDLLFPAGVFMCYGKRIKAELAGGTTITSIVYPDPEDLKPARRSEIHGWATVGMRYQRSTNGLLLRLAYTPIIEFGVWRHWAGASVGYAF